MTQQTEPAISMSAAVREQNLTKIRAWVDAYRHRNNVQQVGQVSLPELSCFLTGEGYNLLIRQLVNTEYPNGDWSELINDKTGEIIQLVLDEMPKH